jgi:hypothetical protein
MVVDGLKAKVVRVEAERDAALADPDGKWSQALLKVEAELARALKVVEAVDEYVALLESESDDDQSADPFAHGQAFATRRIAADLRDRIAAVDAYDPAGTGGDDAA